MVSYKISFLEGRCRISPTSKKALQAPGLQGFFAALLRMWSQRLTTCGYLHAGASYPAGPRGGAWDKVTDGKDQESLIKIRQGKPHYFSFLGRSLPNSQALMDRTNRAVIMKK
jgi:hypothetical protein